MKWLEIIELLTMQIDRHMLEQLICILMDEMKIEYPFRIYINLEANTGWSIHVQHESETVEMQGSEFSRRLKNKLKEFGLVNHSIWIEQ